MHESIFDYFHFSKIQVETSKLTPVSTVVDLKNAIQEHQTKDFSKKKLFKSTSTYEVHNKELEEIESSFTLTEDQQNARSLINQLDSKLKALNERAETHERKWQSFINLDKVYKKVGKDSQDSLRKQVNLKNLTSSYNLKKNELKWL